MMNVEVLVAPCAVTSRGHLCFESCSELAKQLRFCREWVCTVDEVRTRDCSRRGNICDDSAGHVHLVAKRHSMPGAPHRKACASALELHAASGETPGHGSSVRQAAKPCGQRHNCGTRSGSPKGKRRIGLLGSAVGHKLPSCV